MKVTKRKAKQAAGAIARYYLGRRRWVRAGASYRVSVIVRMQPVWQAPGDEKYKGDAEILFDVTFSRKADHDD